MTWNTQNQILVTTIQGEAVSDITSCLDLVRLQDYLLSHMYANAARDDLWSKLSQVSFTCEARRCPGSQTYRCSYLPHTVRLHFIMISAGKASLPWQQTAVLLSVQLNSFLRPG